MGMPPEYISPWADQIPNDPEERTKADEAFVRLFELYNTPEVTATPEGQIDSFRRLLRTLQAYYRFSVRAAGEGLVEGQRDSFIKEGLRADALIDPSDPTKAEHEFRIIADGYELNRQYWDEKLGRRRRFINDLKDM